LDDHQIDVMSLRLLGGVQAVYPWSTKANCTCCAVAFLNLLTQLPDLGSLLLVGPL
jgi:hypothetical protein